MGGITGRPWIRDHQCANTDARRHRGTQVLPYLLSLGYRKIWGAILAPGTSDPPSPPLPDAQNSTHCCAHQIRTVVRGFSAAHIYSLPGVYFPGESPVDGVVD